MSLKIYADKKCTIELKTIEWDSALILNLVTGKKVTLPNTAKANQVSMAIAYIRNEYDYPFAITSVSHEDNRINITIDEGYLKPNDITKITVEYFVPEKVTPADVVKKGVIVISGHIIYGV